MASSQDLEAEEDFQKQGLVCFFEGMKEKEWSRVQNLRSRGGFGERKVQFCHVT